MTCYISRVENGHKMPSIATLERFAEALGVPLHQLFLERDDPGSIAPNVVRRRVAAGPAAELRRPNSADVFISKMNGFLTRIPERDRGVLLVVARKMASRTETVRVPQQ
jgi:transcriptional regulator with XRE-family HTH domain